MTSLKMTLCKIYDNFIIETGSTSDDSSDTNCESAGIWTLRIGPAT